MLKLYDYLEGVMEEHNRKQWLFDTKLDHFASEVMEVLEINDPLEADLSLQRALLACRALQFPDGNNFKQVYRFNGEQLLVDWRLSPLACYLLIINCSPANELVARAQLFFAMNQKAGVK
ncbi:MAG: hypothetical protein ACJ76F_10375 [Bacteroidia bacterium]